MGRRGNGSGSVYRSREPKRRKPWCAVVVVGWSPRGTPIRVSRWFTTRREAESARARMSAALAETGELPDDRITLMDYLDGWLRTREGMNPRSLAAYRRAVAHLNATIGHHRLASLRPLTIEAGLREIAVHSPSTATLCRKVLSVALHDAERNGTITRNPAALVRLAPPPPTRRRTPSVDEVRLLLERDDRGILTVLLTTGLRAGELCGLRWEDIEGDRLTVRRQLVAVPGGWATDEPKTPGSARMLALAPVAVDALRRWRSAVSGPVWPGLTPNSLNRLIAAACEEAGVPRFTAHGARYFVATMLAGDPKVAASTLGHASAAMSLDVYARTTDEARRRAAERMQEVVG